MESLTWEYFVGFIFLTMVSYVIGKVMKSDPVQKDVFNASQVAIRKEMNTGFKESRDEQIKCKDQIYKDFVHNDRFDRYEKEQDRRFNEIADQHKSFNEKLDKLLER